MFDSFLEPQLFLQVVMQPLKSLSPMLGAFLGVSLVSLLACGGGEDGSAASPVSSARAASGAPIDLSAPTGKMLRVDMLDVGQGDSILIRTPQKTILIDASEGSADVIDKLKAIGVASLDLVVATHPHADHIGGMDDVVNALPIKLFIDNGLPHTTKTYSGLMADLQTRGVTYRAAVAGTVFNLDLGAKLEVMFPTGSPLTGTRSDLNANSVVTRLTYGSDCFLFTGDAEEPTEQALVSRGLTPCGVLKVAHHGSEYSSTQAFLNAVQPKIALISVGTGNTYGHPGPATVSRLEAMGAKVYRTDLLGTVSVTSSGSGVTVLSGAAAVAAPAPRPPPTLTTGPKPTAAAVTTRALPAGSACPFLSTSSSSEVFHEAGCGQSERSDPAGRVCYESREKAVAAGKRPAGCCDP